MKTLLEIIDTTNELNILNMDRKPKNIHLTDGAIKFLSIKAIENGTNFKNYVEGLLEAMSQTQSLPKAANRGEKKKKKKNAA